MTLRTRWVTLMAPWNTCYASISGEGQVMDNRKSNHLKECIQRVQNGGAANIALVDGDGKSPGLHARQNALWVSEEIEPKP